MNTVLRTKEKIPLNNRYIEVEKNSETLHSGHLILVNRENPFTPQDIRSSVVSASDFRFYGNEKIYLEESCSRNLSALIRACGAEGKLIAVSGLRSEAEQRAIYHNSLRENGREFTQKYVARPMESEHQTGLAIDLSEDTDCVDFIRPSFPDKGACKAFKSAAASYGFILRYQKEKGALTGISEEPWHFRYIGVPHACLMNRYGFCLEEYIEFIRRFPFDGTHLFVKESVETIEIYFVPAIGSVTMIPLPAGKRSRISGNNRDGFIVTVFHGRGEGENG